MKHRLDVGDVVRAMRRGQRLSQAQLAKAAGISTNLVSRVERGATNYRRATLDNIATALRTDVATLTGGGGTPQHEDGATRKLLALWYGLPLEHRQAAIDAVEHVSAMAATVVRLEAQLAQLTAAHDKTEPRRGKPARVRGKVANDR
jgi:transcriptional regulator with XRE-family HTH domain